jgi:acyl carrier protein
MNQSEIKAHLKQYICTDLLRRPDYPLGDDEALISGGLIDSHALVQLSIFVESTFAIVIPDEDFSVAHMDTLNLICSRVDQALNPA